MDLLHLIRELPIEHLLLGVSSLLLLSVFASRVSSRIGIPALLLFLAIGMLVGSEGPGGIAFDYPRLVQSLGVVALALILFSGGLDTHWADIRPVLWKGVALSTIGVCVSTGLVALFAVLLLDFSPIEGLLLGAIVSSTDAAAVFSVLRGQGTKFRGPTLPLVELESASNDPMAVFLTVGLIGVLSHPGSGLLGIVPMFFQQMLLGGLLGYGIGAGMAALTRHLHLETDGMYAVLSLAGALFTYGFTESVGGNGFLAVYLAGLTMGNSGIRQVERLRRFHEGQAGLMQILMFLALGLQVFPSHIGPVVGIGLVLSLFLMFVARPAAVLLTLFPTDLSVKDMLLVSWLGLRGAVPIVLATFPMIAGLPRADTIFNLVFFVVLTSVLLQGTTLPFIVRRLGHSDPDLRPLRKVSGE